MRLLVCLAVLLVATACGGSGDDRSYGGVSHLRQEPPSTRVASYAGLELHVPEDWVPAGLGCAEPDQGYVARPLPWACPGGDTGRERPTHEAVWFASPLPLGRRTAGELRLRTVERAGVRVTVAAADDDTVATVLASAGRVHTDSNGCAVRPEPPGIYPDAGLGDVVRFAVCLYAGPDGTLLWSTELSPSAGQRFLRAEHRARRLHRPVTPPGSADPVLVLAVTADEDFGTYPVTVYFRVDPRKRVVTGGPGLRDVALDRALAEPWTGSGVRALLPGDASP